MLVPKTLTLGGTNYINNVTSKRAGNVSDIKPYFVPPKVRFSGTNIVRKPYVARDKIHK